jgi:glycosyltransferase involved in cell wall biosynthesis
MGLLKELPFPSENKKGWPWVEEINSEVYNYKNDWPTISIVVPSYNQGIFLEETLRSILLQNYPSIELIIIDGGSKDETVDIIKKYEPWIKYWVSEKDKGQSDAINKGFARVTGDIVTWLCSDDLFTKAALKKVANIFSDLGDDIGLIYGGATLFGENIKSTETWGYDDAGIERYIAGQAFPQPSAFFKRKFLQKAGNWVREDLHMGMDFDLFARLGCVCKFHSVKEIFSLYRLHPASKTVSQYSGFIEDWTRSFGNLCRNFGWHDLVEKMETIPQLSVFLNYSYPFKANEQMILSVDKKLALFYHLCYWLKSCYQNKRRDDARQILAILKKDFPSQWMAKEKHIPQIVTRLKFPDSVLEMLIRLKKSYQDLWVRN